MGVQLSDAQETGELVRKPLTASVELPILRAMSCIDHLLFLARAYGEATETSPVTVSWRVFGDSKKLSALEAGADIQVRRYEAALRWFSENWPADAKWPREIPRPAAERAA